MPNPLKAYTLETDACEVAIGGVLSQENDLGELRPCAFFSRKLQGSDGKGQLAWHIRDKETYAIIMGLKKYSSWIASAMVQIKVLTDHKSLESW